MNDLMRTEISDACRGTSPRSPGRMRALASVRWVLATDDNRFVTINDQLKASLTPQANEATVYDGRDNEELKRKFMEALLKTSLTVVLLAK